MKNRLREAKLDVNNAKTEFKIITEKQHELVQKKEELFVIEERLEKAQLEVKTATTEFQTIQNLQHNELVRGAIELDEISNEKERVSEKVDECKESLKEIQNTYDRLKILLSRKESAKAKRQNNQSSKELLSSNNTTKYRRRKETKNLLEFVHGGEDAAINGAWDFLSSQCNQEKMEELVTDFRRGKFLQTIFKKQVESDEVKLKKAIASKYLGHLSRRRFNLLCKIQDASFKSNEGLDVGELIPRNEEVKLDLRSKQLSHYTVDKFIKTLDIGEIHEIPSCSGVARTVTGLVTMVVDVNLKVEANRERLHWFNNIENHFIIEFSDDGAPESKEVTMTIGTLSLWNYQNRIRSRDHHYPLHMLSIDEKNAICEDLWRQHSDEMLLIEGNIFTINSEKITFEFQPSADQSWQCWAANVLPSSATYPSPYANVHKSQLDMIDGTIGFENHHTWKPPTNESRKIELEKLNTFRKTLSPSLSPSAKHSQELAFLADNGYRILGESRIGIFADRLRPEPLHLEINNWQHILNLIYLESIRRGKFESFCKVLESPIRCETNPGCGLKFVAKKIKEHYEKEAQRTNVLDVRLIGAQAISLSRFCTRVLDAIHVDESSEAAKLKHQALYLICIQLRNIGGMMNRVIVTKDYPRSLKEVCRLYFNLLSLFFPEHCQSTVWTLGYALPYHADVLYEKYKVGYGILSMQGKESFHSSIKQQLKSETNRSNSDNLKGKWAQIMRSSYVRNFYLPYHFPLAPTYHSHYQTRLMDMNEGETYCQQCARKLVVNGDSICNVCHDSSMVIQAARDGKIDDNICTILKPIQCVECEERFADVTLRDRHYENSHKGLHVDANAIIPSTMTVKDLKTELKRLGKSTSGNRDLLIRRLEGLL